MKLRADLLDAQAKPGIEVYQLTDECLPSCHVYMEAQIFTPDSKRLVLHRSAQPHGSRQEDSEHRYLLCDLENAGALSPLTDEVGVTGPSVSPDGLWLYYFVDETRLNGGRLILKRVKLDGTGRETIVTLDTPARNAWRMISRVYPLSTISSDGERIAISGFIGDGRREPPPWGLLLFDIAKATAELILEGPSWCNVHPQFCRSTEPQAAHDIMVQENHGNVTQADGRTDEGVNMLGADIHLIRDDGSCFRDLPWGRDGNEFCEGHQCWRGRTTAAITSADTMDTRQSQLLEGVCGPHAGHKGLKMTGARRNDLSRSFPVPQFHHFATDIAGRRLVTDHMQPGQRTFQLYLADLGRELEEPLKNWTRLLDTGSSDSSATHPHPFLSPDGRRAFFNSNESGLLQAYMVSGI